MASPWGKVEKLEPTNFEEIMSEEYARGLQDLENKKYEDSLAKKETPEELYKIPDDVLKVIQDDENLLASGNKKDPDICQSDASIAHLLQLQFDREHNAELERLEKLRNKDSKISISYQKYRQETVNHEDPDEDNDYDDYDNNKSDWDRFEANEKKFLGIPKWGSKIDEAGERITKHNPQICGVRNACRLMSFPTEFSTGDAAGFDMKLSNSVFNQLKTYSRKSKRSKQQDRKENTATAEMGLDEITRLLLYKLINNQILEQINGIISTGKEALILHAYGMKSLNPDIQLPKECAIKIFKTTLNEFKQRDRYIKDDYRFKDRFSKQNNNRTIINMWAEKEMHNLNRLQKSGINCPNVVVLKKHILVMSFIGDDHQPAQKLKDANLSEPELYLAYEDIIKIMHKMYNKAHLVHADLSEYNILWYNDQCWLIDVAQSVEPKNPNALEFLLRDCNNIINFFTKRGLTNLYTKEDLFEYITTLKPNLHNNNTFDGIPFDLAWETSMKERKNGKTIKNHIQNEIIENMDALKILNVQNSVEIETENK